jgi:hypothetical protein
MKRWPVVTGLLLIGLHFEIGEALFFGGTYGTSRFGSAPWDIDNREYRFWLSHGVLVVLGALALGYGLAPRAAPWVASLRAACLRLSPRAWRCVAAGFFVVLCAAAGLGRSVWLLDLPITDDENGALFGGRMIAEGDLRVPALRPDGAFTDLYLYRRAGFVSSMEFPGILLVTALAEKIRLGSTLFALLAASGGLPRCSPA